MILNLIYLALSLFGLGFLIFIHEYGHYIVGKKMGMKVETFSIGFGKPLKTWKSGDVIFQLGTIPFGGFVKFKGLDGDRSSSDGFYSVPFYKRIFVAFAGPLANLILALVVFVLIFMMGGRRVDFAEKNPFVGYLRNQGVLFNQGLREGDMINSINGRPYSSFQDFMVEKVTTKGVLTLEAKPFPWNGNQLITCSFKEGGFLPGSYLIFEKVPNIVPNEMSYLKHFGVEKGDRLLSVNGQPIFSKASLVEYLQKTNVLIHIERQGQIFSANVPKLAPNEIKLNTQQNGELTDWMHNAGLKSVQYFIPYDLNQDLVVERVCEYLNNDSSWQMPSASSELDTLYQPLNIGDKIIAVNGRLVSSGASLLQALDENSVHVVIEKRKSLSLVSSEANIDFWAPYLTNDYNQLMLDPSSSKAGQFIQLNVPIIRLDQLKLSEAEQNRQKSLYESELARINKIKDQKQRSYELKELEMSQKRFMIGGLFNDQKVRFNPNPFSELYDACALTFKTLSSLVKGGLSPKQLSGPVAIVGVMQHGAQKSMIEGLYYFAIISINLALFNLLPLPVLDGGHICFALYEGIVGKPVPQKVMEKLTFVFVVLLIALIVYATYNDILRFIRNLF
jgi:regulator of sigma E protease